MTTTATAHILLDDQGRAWVEGTNTKVIEIVLDKIAYGWSPEEMHRQHPHLPLSKIYAALSYYYDHQSEIDAQVQQQASNLEAQRNAAGSSPVAHTLRSTGKLA